MKIMTWESLCNRGDNVLKGIVKAIYSTMVCLLVPCILSSIPVQAAPKNDKSEGNPPFINKLKTDIVPQISTFNDVVVNSTQYNDVPVYTEGGKIVHLDARRQPILFEAYWCPHCQRTLVMLNKHRSQFGRFPILVSFGFQPNTSLHQAIKLTNAETKAFNIKNVKVYYILQYHIRNYAPNGIPELVFFHNGKLESLSGEHTLQIWETALEKR